MYPRDELAIVSEVCFGCCDGGAPALSFRVSGLGWSTVIMLEVDRALDLIRSAQCTDINRLNGKPCVVNLAGALGKATFRHMY